MEELNGILQATILVRRLKKDVLKDLPDKMRREVAIEISAKDQKVSASQQDASNCTCSCAFSHAVNQSATCLINDHHGYYRARSARSI